MELGISSYTYTWAVGVSGSPPPSPLTATDLIDKAVGHDLKVVQIADNLPLELLSYEELAALRSYAEKRGIRLEMGGRGLNPKHTIKCLDAAAAINSPILRMVIDATGFEPDLNTIISIIKELLPEFKSRNIRLAIENHDRLKAREFEHIIQAVGSDFAGICLDSVNSMGAGEGFEEVSWILLPYTINLHIKDFTIRRVAHKMGMIIEGAPAGKGMLKIRELVANLSSTERCSSGILELWTPPEKTIEETIKKEEEWAKKSISFLKTIMSDNMH